MAALALARVGVLVRAKVVALDLGKVAALVVAFSASAAVSARPSIVYRVEPTYSEEARKAKYQGVVVLSAIVRKDGTIEILKVVRGLGLGLDENAIQALKQWKFRPGMKNGVPVDVALNIEVNFSLR